jgi:hypothetical protein
MSSAAKKNSPNFMEGEISILSSQEPATVPYTEPHQYIP